MVPHGDSVVWCFDGILAAVDKTKSTSPAVPHYCYPARYGRQSLGIVGVQYRPANKKSPTTNERLSYGGKLRILDQ